MTLSRLGAGDAEPSVVPRIRSVSCEKLLAHLEIQVCQCSRTVTDWEYAVGQEVTSQSLVAVLCELEDGIR